MAWLHFGSFAGAYGDGGEYSPNLSYRLEIFFSEMVEPHGRRQGGWGDASPGSKFWGTSHAEMTTFKEKFLISYIF